MKWLVVRLVTPCLAPLAGRVGSLEDRFFLPDHPASQLNPKGGTPHDRVRPSYPIRVVFQYSR